MVSDESSECRSCYPLCNLRLLNWMRRLTRDQTDYKSAIETDLWTQIQEQFQPYNPNGKLANDYGSEEIKRQISSKGEVAEEYRHLVEQKRNQFLEEKSQEEKENLELLNSIEDPELQEEIRKQLEAERRLMELKIRKSFKMNPTKTECIMFGNKTKRNKLGDSVETPIGVIEIKNEANILGLRIDDELSFSPQFE